MRDTVAKRRPMIDLEQFERRLRQPNAANRTDEDPLTELARLVGRADDPYKSVFEPQTSHGAAGASETHDYYEADAWDEAQQQNFDAEEGADEGLSGGVYGSIGTGPSADRVPSHDDAGLHAFASDDQSEHWGYEDEAEAPAGSGYELEQRSRRPLYVMAAIIVAGIAGIGVSFALKGGSAPHEIAMIKAADGPVKVEPEATAGADAPNQDASILNRTPQAAPVAVADATEQPVDLSHLPDHTPRAAAAGGANAGAASVAVPLSPSHGSAPSQGFAAPQASMAPQSIAGLIEPKKVKTVSVRPDGTLLPNDAAPQTPSATALSPAHVVAPPAAKASTPKSTARVATTPKPTAAPGGADVAHAPDPKSPQVADAQGALAPAAESPAGGGAFSVQLAAPSSEQEARDIQLRLMKKYGAEIPGFHPSIRKAVSGDKTVYRVRTVGLSKDDATALCQKVQSSGGNCFVAKN
jgi:hypothetical protein